MVKKRALITGAATRLGAAMAQAISDDGFDVVIHYATSADDAEQLAARLNAQGRRAALLQADLLDEDQLSGLIARAADMLEGPLDLLVNNASIFEHDTLQTATRQSWDRHMGSNLRAPFVLSQDFAAQVPPPLMDGNAEPIARGLIVNMIDQRVRKLTPEFMTYTLAKYALWGLTQTSAQALAPHVRVNAIGPGPTLQGSRQGPEDFAAQRSATILQRGAHPSEIIAALRYFLTATSVTGQMLCVDGGQHLAWQTPDVAGVE